MSFPIHVGHHLLVLRRLYSYVLGLYNQAGKWPPCSWGEKIDKIIDKINIKKYKWGLSSKIEQN